MNFGGKDAFYMKDNKKYSNIYSLLPYTSLQLHNNVGAHTVD